MLDGDEKGCVVTFQTGAREDTRLDGFTVTNGRSVINAGISCVATSPTIANNVVVGNGSTGWGGGIVCYCLAAPAIVNNLIESNFASDAYGDGGIYCIGSDPLIAGNTIVNYIATQDGGGVFATGDAPDGSPVATPNCNHASANNIVEGDGGDAHGGGILIVDAPTSTPVVANNTVVANSGHGICWGNASPGVVNHIIAFNSAGVSRDTYAGGLPVFRDNCVWANNQYGGAGFDYSGVTDPTGQNGNTRADPRFVNLNPFDPHLGNGSACIDAGNDAVLRLGETDADG